MLKFKFKSEEGAREAKAHIQEAAETLDYITLGDVIHNYGEPVESTYPFQLEQAHSVGWLRSKLKGQNIIVKKVRKIWYLYLCDPSDDFCYKDPEENVSYAIPEDPTLYIDSNGLRVQLPVTKTIDDIVEELEKMRNILAQMVLTNDDRRKCMVWRKSKKKNVIAEEFPCWCHGWMPNRVMKANGDSIDQTLFICEFQDGHVERIDHSHIRFVEEWE